MKRIILTGGGTAGHVTPNIALIPELQKRGYEIHYVGSKDGIEKKLMEEFVIPYYVKVMDKWKEWGSRGSGFHICGDTTKLLETFPEMGIRGVSIDSAVDIAVAKDLVGDKLSIMGNVSPIEILRGTPESIEQAVIDCFRKCWDNPRGFTIAPGCDIPVQTSLENIDAYMSAARKCAKYPVQPSNWE